MKGDGGSNYAYLPYGSYKLAKRVLTKFCKKIFACHKLPPSIKKLSPAPAVHVHTHAMQNTDTLPSGAGIKYSPTYKTLPLC